MRSMTRMLMLLAVGAAWSCGGPPPATSTPPVTETSPRATLSLPPPDPNLFQAPQPTDEQRNKIEDIRRDLLAVAAGSSGATSDLTDDLGGLMAHPPASATIQNLGASLDRALRSRSLDEQHSRRLAEILYATLHLPYMPAPQREVVRSAMVQELRAVGVGEPEATAAGLAVAPVK